MWDLLSELIDWLVWPRFQLCWWGGIILGVVAFMIIPTEPMDKIVGVVVCFSFWGFGWWWEGKS